MEQLYLPNQKYKVLVLCHTYNHSKYIEDALNGFAMQKTEFPYVCVVMDDASTDGEQQVIKSWMDRECNMAKAENEEIEKSDIIIVPHKTNPNCIFGFYFLKKNLYRTEKKKELIDPWEENCEYEAMCEGDDYWIVTDKLQKQVDILEKDGTLEAVVTNSIEVDENGSVIRQKFENVVYNNVEKRYNLYDFFDYNHSYVTASVLYRNVRRKEIHDMYKKTLNPYFGDWNLWIVLHVFGDFYYLNQSTCAYRINPASLTHSNTNERRLNVAKANFKIIKNISDALPDRYMDIKKDLKNTGYMWFTLANAYRHLHKYFQMIFCLMVCCVKCPKYMIEKINHGLHK